MHRIFLGVRRTDSLIISGATVCHGRHGIEDAGLGTGRNVLPRLGRDSGDQSGENKSELHGAGFIGDRLGIVNQIAVAWMSGDGNILIVEQVIGGFIYTPRGRKICLIP